ncbi:hypothetical protein GDO81_016275 [Engystomops pustulosus]|uniref:Uncharacterized protein n=1 Tax=Engystomops pustulosus TaxID=76066 RepID=A0AAV7AQZ6_ENGPU|nr:hypothetical protein GDO81_016275 [Engystomops pustulosus]
MNRAFYFGTGRIPKSPPIMSLIGLCDTCLRKKSPAQQLSTDIHPKPTAPIVYVLNYTTSTIQPNGIGSLRPPPATTAQPVV